MLRPIVALWRREVLKFVRDRGRIIGAIGQPIGFWLVLGLGFRGTFQMPAATGLEHNYLVFLFPGVLLLTVLFTAIFSTISIIEERKSGFLQAAVVAPIPRSALLAGTLSGGVTLSLAETLLFLAALPLLPLHPGTSGVFLAVGILVLAAIAFTSMGIAFAWRMASTRGFHGVMNVLMLPMWLLSGAVFPMEGAHPILAVVMRLNPVTYVMNSVRGALIHGAVSWPDLAVTMAFSAIMVWTGLRMIRIAPSSAS